MLETVVRLSLSVVPCSGNSSATVGNDGGVGVGGGGGGGEEGLLNDGSSKTC
jgi:hypothetical protein